MKKFNIHIFFAFIIVLSSCATKLPVEKGLFKETNLVELVKLDSTIHLDIRYATPNNFAKQAVYKEARAFLQKDAAESLKRINASLKPLGYGLLVFDGYRPWDVTKLFYDITSKENKKFVADPKEGSRHNRGCAIDVSLYDLQTGKEIPMPGVYDEMTERSYVDYTGGTEEQKKTRNLLIEKMQAEGFTVYKYEWWHFDYKDWQLYRITNKAFSEIN
ncbi:MAG: family metallopeptidase [Bacteroidetes bacterium]|jgi:D-alanyl-D-alanine dipeptidase|nr:family metallopeptidase [Bacteroidota bacterium]MDF2452841.1 family metallopeptidase [Bacteroidota bacterium]